MSRVPNSGRISSYLRTFGVQKYNFRPIRSLNIIVNSKNIYQPSPRGQASHFRITSCFDITYSRLAHTTVKVPQIADSITEGTLKQWTKKIGEYVKQDEEIAIIETEKVDVAVNATSSGVLMDIFAQEEDTVAVGADLCKIDTEGKPTDKPSPPKEDKSDTPKDAPKPKEEEVAKPKEEPLRQPAPSTQPPSPSPSTTSHTPSSTPTESPSNYLGERVVRKVKMSRMRTTIANRLKASQNTAASLTTFNEVDMSNLISLRKDYKDLILKKHDIKFGFMSAFVKASSNALMSSPEVNATIEDNHIVYNDFVDVSVAVATPKGLVTPVLRNTNKMSMIQIEQEIAELGRKARENKIAIEDMTGGTFTISNGGVFGSLMGTPIINLPQSAILGMHAIKERPVVVNGKIEIRPMMYLALTYDHRLIDGREAVTFLVKIKETIEDPRRLLLDL